MEILKGALLAAAWGYLISLVLAFLLALVFTSILPDPGFGSGVLFIISGTFTMSLMISVVVVPASFVLGLVYSSVRSAVRQGVEQGRASSSDS